MASGRAAGRRVGVYRTVGFGLKLAQQALRSHLDAQLRTIGLTTPQYAVLAFLRTNAGASNAALARKAFVTPQTMQAILVNLERARFITRAPHAHHGRVQVTQLTPAGEEILDAASQVVGEAERRLKTAAAPLDPDDVMDMLDRLARAFDD